MSNDSKPRRKASRSTAVAVVQCRACLSEDLTFVALTNRVESGGVGPDGIYSAVEWHRYECRACGTKFVHRHLVPA